jgi:hypothetical protein
MAVSVYSQNEGQVILHFELMKHLKCANNLIFHDLQFKLHGINKGVILSVVENNLATNKKVMKGSLINVD